MSRPSAGFAIGCLALVIAASGTAVAAGGPFSLADPVHGKYKARVSSDGALSVKVANPVTRVGVDGTVPVTGSVTVGNTVPVTGKVGIDGTVPVSGTVTTKVAPGLPGTPVFYTGSLAYTVPAGRTLVVQTIELGCLVSQGATVGGVLHVVTSGTAGSLTVPLTLAYSYSSLDQYIGVLSATAYADAGSKVSGLCSNLNGSLSSSYLHVSGYLV